MSAVLTTIVAPTLLVLITGVAAEARLAKQRRRVPGLGPPGTTTSARTTSRPTLRRVREPWMRSVRLRRRSEPPPTDQEVADWCDALARRVRTGDSLVVALHTVRSTPSVELALAPVALALERGAGAATAIVAARHRSSGLDAAVGVIEACATLGGPAAEPLDRVAATMRRRVADGADRHAQSAQARLSALTLTVLPAAVLAVLAATSSAVRSSMGSTAVMLSVGAGACLNVVGWRWMRTIIGTAS